MKHTHSPLTSTVSRLVPSRLLTASLALGAVLPASAANLIVNGDFSGGTGGTLDPGSPTATNNQVPTGWTGFATGQGAIKVQSNMVNFNGENRPTGSYIEQDVTTSANRWYVLDWQQASHTGGDSSGVAVTSTLTSGASSTTNRYRGMASPQSLILAGGTTTTVRLSDDGATTGSLDTRIDNVSFDLANGQYNMAGLAIINASSTHAAFGTDPYNAVDGRTGGESNTNYHSQSAGGMFELDFTANFANALIDRIEIEARSGFNNRKGDLIEIYSTSGSLIESISITGADDLAASYGIDGYWRNVGRIVVTENGQTLNVSEVRAFSSFIDGVAVPEPGSSSLLALGGVALLLRRRK
ncbi:hypothetical protein NT6N_15310 [Oceaniferula spumae]|uniref:Ice-binding protein C-terminal domain-containing protein n=1 Tax=Oceaniferula spumae TaxID=2979115 RepID=A0AAT9FKG1_9BACT